MLKFFFLGLLGILCAGSAIAGTEISGGGNAVVCYHESGTIRSAELLDLYEGRAKYGLAPSASGANAEEQMVHALEVVSRGLERDGILVYQGKAILRSMKVLPSGQGLKPVDDSNHIVLPKSCRIAQVARYEPNDELFIDGDIWQHFDETNRAALLTHETVYWYLRMLGEQNSDRTRKIVSHVFAGRDLVPVDEGVPTDAELCRVEAGEEELAWAEFATYPGKDGSRVLQFASIGGKMAVGKTTGVVYSPDPLAQGKAGWTSFMKLDSAIDGGVNVFIALTPGGASTGKIGIGTGSGMPTWHLFNCK